MLVEKPAVTQYPIHELLSRRWSPRAFSDRPVGREKLLSLLEAARWAPSSNNEQPWRFLMATKDRPEEFARMLSCLVDGNQVWAKNAPVLLLSVAELLFSNNNKPNRHAFHDVGLATANLMIEATALGLAVHAMAGMYPDKARDLYGVPTDYEVVAGIAVGYQADLDAIPPNLRERELAPRSHKPLDEIVFSGRWGTATPLISSGK